MRVFWPCPSAYSAHGSEKDDCRGCCGWSSLSTAHASVAAYCFQLQKEVTITAVGYQMAGVSSRGLLVHHEDHHLSWLPLLLHFQNNAIILLSCMLFLPSCVLSHISPSFPGTLWVSQCQSLSLG